VRDDGKGAPGGDGLLEAAVGLDQFFCHENLPTSSSKSLQTPDDLAEGVKNGHGKKAP